MFPDLALSSATIQAEFTEQVNRRQTPLVDYEMGGVAVGDSSAGLKAKLWTLELQGADLVLSAEGVAPVVLFSRADVTQVALAFDQNMRPHVAFVQAGLAWLWWYDSQANQMAFTSFAGVTTPRLANDEKRASQASVSDVVLAYMAAGNLCVRIQRERFAVEHVLRSAPGLMLVAVARNNANRLQFECFPIA